MHLAVCTPTKCVQVPMEARRWHWLPMDLAFIKGWGADNVVPAIEPRSSIVAANAFGHQAQPQISVLNA